MNSLPGQGQNILKIPIEICGAIPSEFTGSMGNTFVVIVSFRPPAAVVALALDGITIFGTTRGPVMAAGLDCPGIMVCRPFGNFRATRWSACRPKLREKPPFGWGATRWEAILAISYDAGDRNVRRGR